MTLREPLALALGLMRLTKLASIYAVAAALFAISPAVSFAQSSVGSLSRLEVPTTKLLAIGSFTAKATPTRWKPLLPSEVRSTVKLYLMGKIDQWYVKPDQSGVVFVMNLTDPKEAYDLLAQLPLGQAGFMEFQIIPLGPLSPLTALLAGP